MKCEAQKLIDRLEEDPELIKDFNELWTTARALDIDDSEDDDEEDLEDDEEEES